MNSDLIVENTSQKADFGILPAIKNECMVSTGIMIFAHTTYIHVCILYIPIYIIHNALIQYSRQPAALHRPLKKPNEVILSTMVNNW